MHQSDSVYMFSVCCVQFMYLLDVLQVPYLGTRSTDSTGKAGPYTWMTYAEVWCQAQSLLQIMPIDRTQLRHMCAGCRDPYTHWLRFAASWNQAWRHCGPLLSQSCRSAAFPRCMHGFPCRLQVLGVLQHDDCRAASIEPAWCQCWHGNLAD